MTARARFARNEPLHVALLGQANSIHLQRWAIGLAARGLRVSVITQQGREALPLPPAIALHVLPHRGAIGYLLNALALRRLLHELRPDLLHAHYASGYGTLAMLARFHPWMLSVWGADVYDFPVRSRLHSWLIVRNLRAADRLGSTSETMKRQVLRLWPRAGPIDVTPFGVDTERFRPAPRVQSRLVIGTVKTLTPKYGIDVLIRAFARLTASGLRPDAHLLIVGDGPERPALEALAVASGVAPRVQFIGAVGHAQVPQWLQRMDIYVAASRDDSESFGVAVLEASACAVPVVVSDAGGLPEVVQHQVSGLVVPRDDSVALADALATLVASPELRQRMGVAGRQRVIDHYDWPRCVDTMLDSYEALLASSRRTVP
jgi:glycosyltransferase involved in cell wall biosynthesis